MSKSTVALKIQGIGKRYRIGDLQPYLTVRDTIIHWLSFKTRTPPEDFWALRDVTVDIQAGEVVGLIGANGAGKSTLLKILSRITEPTEGEVLVRGRVASLLEVGTGFHSELTGEENIYLNGAILGMSRAQIRRHFDEIVEFSGVSRFLDTPVKHYSSGMSVRLAFAVAAHLRPEILVVDEVLAVGDLQFQRKCMGKMGEVSAGGRTVIFVSHDLSAISRLCSSAIWLEQGRIRAVGPTSEVVAQYETSAADPTATRGGVFNRGRGPGIETAVAALYSRPPPPASGPCSIRFIRARIEDEEGAECQRFRYLDTMFLTVDLEGEPEGPFVLEAHFFRLDSGAHVFSTNSGETGNVQYPPFVRSVRIEVGPMALASGEYTISFSLLVRTIRTDNWIDACVFTVFGCRPYPNGYEQIHGVMVLPHRFLPASAASDTNA